MVHIPLKLVNLKINLWSDFLCWFRLNLTYGEQTTRQNFKLHFGQKFQRNTIFNYSWLFCLGFQYNLPVHQFHTKWKKSNYFHTHLFVAVGLPFCSLHIYKHTGIIFVEEEKALFTFIEYQCLFQILHGIWATHSSVNSILLLAVSRRIEKPNIRCTQNGQQAKQVTNMCSVTIVLISIKTLNKKSME